MPEVAPRRPGLTSLTRGNVDAFPFWGKYYAETELCGWATRIRTKACILHAGMISSRLSIFLL
jgi:hypothetical protein